MWEVLGLTLSVCASTYLGSSLTELTMLSYFTYHFSSNTIPCKCLTKRPVDNFPEKHRIRSSLKQPLNIQTSLWALFLFHEKFPSWKSIFPTSNKCESDICSQLITGGYLPEFPPQDVIQTLLTYKKVYLKSI